MNSKNINPRRNNSFMKINHILIFLIVFLLLISSINIYYYQRRVSQEVYRKNYVEPLIGLVENIENIKKVNFILNKNTIDNYYNKDEKLEFFKSLNNFKKETPSSSVIKNLKTKLLDTNLTEKSREFIVFSPWFPSKIFIVEVKNKFCVWFIYEKSNKSIYLYRYDSEGEYIDAFESKIALSELSDDN